MSSLKCNACMENSAEYHHGDSSCSRPASARSLARVNDWSTSSVRDCSGKRAGRRRTVENVYATLTSILDKGRKWGYEVPGVKRRAPQPCKLMFLIAALCRLRIGEVTALKVTSVDFKRKVILINSALDHATRKETTPKSKNSASPVVMPNLLADHLRN